MLVWILPQYPAGWFWCRACDAAGDMVQLASQLWKLDVPQALQELGRLRDGSAAEWHELSFAYEQDCSQQLALTAGLQQLRQELTPRTQSDAANEAFQTELSSDFLADLESPLVATGDAINELLYSQMGRRLRVQAGGRYLVIPSCELPRRPVCASVYRMDWTAVGQLPFRPVRTINKKAEAGIVGLSHALRAGLGGPASCVGLLQLSTAVAVQFRHIRNTGRPLPLIGLVTGRHAESQRAYSWLTSATQLVLWDANTSVDTLRLAMLADASASAYVPPDQFWPLTTTPRAQTQLRCIQQHAVRWHTALGKLLGKLSDAQLAIVAKTFCFTDMQWQHLQKSADSEALRRLRLAKTHGTKPEVKLLDGVTAVVTSDGIWCKNKRILPTWLRISGIILSADSRKRLGLLGTLQFYNHRQPFQWVGTLQQLAATRITDWLETQRLPADQALLLRNADTDPRIRTLHDLVQLALQLDEPPTYDGYSRIGWSSQRGQFQFPGYVLGPSGTADTRQRYIGAGVTPCRHFARPAPLLPSALSQLANANKTAKPDQLWALLAVVLQAALAKVYNQPGLIAGVTGPAAVDALQILQHFGCVSTRSLRHNWPILCTSDRRPARTPAGGAIYHGDPIWAAAAACNGHSVLWCHGWRAVAADDWLTAVVPAFLEWFVRSQQDPGAPNMQSVYGLLRLWWYSLGAAPQRFPIDRSWRELVKQQQFYEQDLFGLLLYQQKLAVDETWLFRDGAAVVRRKGAEYELSAAAFTTAVRHATGLTVDSDDILQRLAASGTGRWAGDRLVMPVETLAAFYTTWIQERLPLQ